MKPLLLDTCVLIDYLRSYRSAVEFIEGLDRPPLISCMTIAELYVGARTQKEQRDVEALLALRIGLGVDADIARRGGTFRRMYRQSHGVDLIDSIIAATAESEGLRLVTRNARHFPMLDDVLVPYS